MTINRVEVSDTVKGFLAPEKPTPKYTNGGKGAQEYLNYCYKTEKEEYAVAFESAKKASIEFADQGKVLEFLPDEAMRGVNDGITFYPIVIPGIYEVSLEVETQKQWRSEASKNGILAIKGSDRWHSMMESDNDPNKEYRTVLILKGAEEPKGTGKFDQYGEDLSHCEISKVEGSEAVKEPGTEYARGFNDGWEARVHKRQDAPWVEKGKKLLIPSEKVEVKEEPIKEVIEFATWYSGMEKSKVLKAFERWKIEIQNN